MNNCQFSLHGGSEGPAGRQQADRAKALSTMAYVGNTNHFFTRNGCRPLPTFLAPNSFIPLSRLAVFSLRKFLPLGVRRKTTW